MKKWNGALALAAAMALAGWAHGEIGIFNNSLDLGIADDNPKLPGSVSYDQQGTYTVTGGGTDWWEWDGERAHFLYSTITGNVRIEANVKILGDPANDWAKAGVAIRNDINTGAGNEMAMNAFTAVTDPFRTYWDDAAQKSVPNPRGAFQGRFLQGKFPMFNYEKVGIQPTKVAVQRTLMPDGQWYLTEGFLDTGAGLEKIGQRYLKMNSTAYVGLAVTSHDNSRTETAEFTNVAISSTTAPQIWDRWEAASVVNGGGIGGMNSFSVRESLSPTDLPGNIASTVAALNSNPPSIDYQAPVLNFHDSDSNGRFGNDATFGVVTAGLKNKGEVENLAVVARGVLWVTDPGPYTFVIPSDDGFELSIDAKIVGKADYGKGANDIVLPATYLTAGAHPIQMIYWEGGGGSSLELFAAKGDWPWFDYDQGGWTKYANWQLVGDVANGGLALVPEPATFGLLALGVLGLAARRRKA
ncbi:MAG: PEP-CTERM sorting domain-containing protein [Planctomycetota bacterium]|nr:PEP-CTERM sorting domain-containing protein [Planctomycetota bacterium]